jgi:restriction system protein
MSKSRRRYRRSNKQDTAWGFLILGLIGVFWNDLMAGEPWAIILVIAIALICVFLIWVLLRKHVIKTPTPSITMKEIDKMTGIEFENFVGELYKAMGYKTEVTQASNDYGADVIVTKDQIKTVIQVKNYKNPVGLGAVQEVNTAKGHYKADEAMIISSSPSFTAQARREAKLLRIKLVARDNLEKLIDKYIPGSIKIENRGYNNE